MLNGKWGVASLYTIRAQSHVTRNVRSGRMGAEPPECQAEALPMGIPLTHPDQTPDQRFLPAQLSIFPLSPSFVIEYQNVLALRQIHYSHAKDFHSTWTHSILILEVKC